MSRCAQVVIFIAQCEYVFKRSIAFDIFANIPLELQQQQPQKITTKTRASAL